jgi:hypothetical protein
MRKLISAALAAVTFAGAVAATAAPAQARDHGGGYYGGGYYQGGGYHRHGDNTGTAVAAGVVGLALGAALASSGNHGGYYARPAAYGYYDGPRYGYYDEPRYRYRTCESTERVWDPYIGRHVLITHHFAC